MLDYGALPEQTHDEAISKETEIEERDDDSKRYGD